LKHCKTEDQVADIFTKVWPRANFDLFRILELHLNFKREHQGGILGSDALFMRKICKYQRNAEIADNSQREKKKKLQATLEGKKTKTKVIKYGWICVEPYIITQSNLYIWAM